MTLEVLDINEPGCVDEDFAIDVPTSFQPISSVGHGARSISFHDVLYEVTQRSCCKRKPNKVILDSVR